MIRRLGGLLAKIAATGLALAFALGAVIGALFGRSVNALDTALQKRASAPVRISPGPGRRRSVVFSAGLILAGLAVAGAILGAVLVVSGAIPIKASSGHWAITEWFLHFTMRRSVATHSLSIQPPRLDDPALILKGATHYEIGCRACHGSPGMRQPQIPLAMTPHPPELPPRIVELKARELFYIVKHGVKFTGMPAWPARNRDDEVWAVVAFLQKMPGLDAADYRRLVRGEPTPAAPIETLAATPQMPRAILESCIRCHGNDGLGRGSSLFPKLAGQRPRYFANALRAYADGARHSGIMGPIAAGLDVETLEELAVYYAGLPPPPNVTADPQKAASIERGRKIAEQGIPKQRVASCNDCHSQLGRHHKPEYPLLAAQPSDYLLQQLELFSKEHRGGSKFAHLMHAVAPRLNSEQMRDVANYFESTRLIPDDATR